MGTWEAPDDLRRIADAARSLYDHLARTGDESLLPEDVVADLRRFRRQLERYVELVRPKRPCVTNFRSTQTWTTTAVRRTRLHHSQREASPLVGPQVVSVHEITVAAYLDTDDDEKLAEIFHRLDELASAMGYQGPTDVEFQYGSVFRRSKAKARELLSSAELKEHLAKVELALDLATLGLKQAR